MRSAALEIIEAGVGVPTFVAAAQPEGCGRNWLADSAIVDDFARRLPAAAEEGIGRAANAQARRFGRADDPGAIVAADGQGLFAVDVLARCEDLQRYLGMGEGDSQVDDNVDVVARQQLVHAAGGQAVLGGEGLGAVGQDIGAGVELDHVKGRAAADVSRRDIARSDDADFQRLHFEILHSVAGDPPGRPYGHSSCMGEPRLAHTH